MDFLKIESLFNIDYQTLIIFSGIYLFLFGIAEIAYHFFDVNVEYTRKFVHLFTGIIALFFPIYIAKPVDLLILCGGFIIILLLTKRFKLLQSVNAIKRSSSGSVLFPIVVIICYMVEYYMQNYVYFFIPILVLSFADTGAALVGKRWPKGRYCILGNSKTLTGVMAFIVIAFLISMSAFYFIGITISMYWIVISLSVAIVAAIGEATSIRGYDNLTIPLCCIGTLLLFQV